MHPDRPYIILTYFLHFSVVANPTIYENASQVLTNIINIINNKYFAGLPFQYLPYFLSCGHKNYILLSNVIQYVSFEFISCKM